MKKQRRNNIGKGKYTMRGIRNVKAASGKGKLTKQQIRALRIELFRAEKYGRVVQMASDWRKINQAEAEAAEGYSMGYNAGYNAGFDDGSFYY
jgi:hypothetical protein